MAGRRAWPARGWVGLGLVAIFWSLNWCLTGLRTHWAFFPLWLGYCLTIDALVELRKGDSPWTRSHAAYIGLFLVSCPAWWLFEIINWRTQNWFYEGRHHFTDLEYGLLASLSFTTVMPAVFGTAELFSTLGWFQRAGGGPRIGARPRSVLILFVLGCVTMVLVLLWPMCFFPFVWISVYLMLDPLNVWLNNRSLMAFTARGDWRPVLALWAGCLVCGFFWEMWNFLSYPKWTYRVPFLDFPRVFEMPVLGYLGYLPFALELFALYHLLMGFLGGAEGPDFIRIEAGDRTGTSVRR